MISLFPIRVINENERHNFSPLFFTLTERPTEKLLVLITRNNVTAFYAVKHFRPYLPCTVPRTVPGAEWMLVPSFCPTTASIDCLLRGELPGSLFSLECELDS